MRRALVTVGLSVALLLSIAAPALAMTPANNGMGKMYGKHISSEAKAGTLGKLSGPRQRPGSTFWPASF